ncbi:MAG: hypothetical protein HWD84_09660 [Flavobacteriaceae bacterium]|nr:hypothetical protein [Flavobacteriaceae bacterium]
MISHNIFNLVYRIVSCSITFPRLTKAIPLSLVFSAILTSSLTAQEIRFVLGGNRYESTWVLLQGEIEAGATQRLEIFLNENFLSTGQPIPEIVLNSPGGDLIEGLKLGLLFRKLKLHTTIGEMTITEDRSPNIGWVSGGEAICASACAYAFLGGIERSIEKDFQIGFHQFYRESSAANLAERLDIHEASADAQKIGGLLIDYLYELSDIDFRILSEAASASRNEVNWIALTRAAELGITTNEKFNKFHLEPYKGGVVAIARSITSISGYDTTRPYDRVAQITTFCRDGSKYLMLSTNTDQSISISDNDALWWSYRKAGENNVSGFITYGNAQVRTFGGHTYVDVNVDEFFDFLLMSEAVELSIEAPRYQGGNFTLTKSLSEDERSFIKASFDFCI